MYTSKTSKDQLRMKTKFTLMLLALTIMLGLQSCGNDPKLTINSNDFGFKAINLTVDGGKLTATGGPTITENWTVNVTINGETTTVSGTCKSDELPVRAGDEIEIRFTPSCPEETVAYFTIPDGTSHKATVNMPTFKWTVPDNFTPGMQIKGESHYETEDAIYNVTGVITLVDLK